jgi:MurNAc alpha-1-phosphate uridylyltransferase
MEKYYFKYKVKNLLMVVNKDKSFDTRFKGDFSLKKNKLTKEVNNDFIYTGCQILNKKVFQNINSNIFSISKIWNDLIDKKELYGYESFNEFIHLTDIEIFKKLN